ncbi:pilin, partial [Oleiphilus sp. HI0066]|uniref:pilin n=3 Tax=Oleiphilus TaxID=141450 RepID=UPI0007C37170
SAVDFYIGHELGHIHRNHLLWSFFILPSSILPLLGAALRRAEEYTCDRYGVACCQSEDDIKAAISAIAAGDTRWKSINVDAYLAQISETNGFWMSFNELISDYPWLTKRMAAALAMNEGREINHPSRHAFAWFLSLFVPRFGSGGGMVSLMITIAIVGILAAVAIPAYQDYVQKARYTEVYIDAEAVSKEVTEYAVVNQAWPESLQTLGYSENYISNATQSSQIAIYENGVIGAQVGINEEGKEQYIVLEPYVEEGNVYWSCYGENLLVKHLPSECQ